jgi:hypothetical protein
MKIVILGWGSLIWDKRDLRIIDDWQNGGPVLRIEFSRISSDGRLTLVIDPKNGHPVTTLFARSAYDNLNDAIANLRERENNPPKERIGYINLVNDTEREYSRAQHPEACDAIKAWAEANNWQAVIWTALPSNFELKREEPFTVAAAAAYVGSLVGDQQSLALEYIHEAPPAVDTPVRRRFHP